MRYCLALIITTALLFASCNNETEKKPLYQVDLTSNKSDTAIKLSSLVEEIRYIKLETNQDNYISWIYGIRILPDKVIVRDRHKILMYSWTGKLESIVDRHGRGPGEYPSIIDFDIDPYKREVIILSSKTLFSYSIDNGNFIQKTNIPGSAFTFRVLDPDNYYFGFPPVTGLPVANNTILNRMGDTIQKSINTILFKTDVYFGFNDEINSYSTQNGVFYKEMMDDTLYHVSVEDGFKPYAVFNTGDYRLSAEKRSFITDDKVNDLMFTGGFFETKEYIFMGVMLNEKNYLTGLKKDDNSYYKFTSGIENDIDGGLQLKVVSVCNDSILISTATASDIISHQFKQEFLPEQNNAFLKLKSEISENDNPVLIIYKLK